MKTFKSVSYPYLCACGRKATSTKWEKSYLAESCRGCQAEKKRAAKAKTE